MKRIFIGCMAALAAAAGLVGCEEKRVTYEGPGYVMFSDTIYTYPVQQSNEVFSVPVTATVAADYDRTYAVEIVDKESNAIEGKHYKLLNNNVVIKAGELTANVEVQGIYDSLEPADSLGFSLKLVLPEDVTWDLYGTGAKVVLHKVCPFYIDMFAGYCRVTSSFFMEYMGVSTRLIKTEVSAEEENTIILKDYYYDGYDAKIKFTTDDIYNPLIEMDEMVCGTTGTAFGTIYGDGKLRMNQASGYASYYSSCEGFVVQYATLSVDNKDGSSYGTVGTYINILEWISDGEAEDMIQEGY